MRLAKRRERVSCVLRGTSLVRPLQELRHPGLCDHTMSLFVMCLLGLAVSSSVVILMVPVLLQPGETVNVWALGVPGCLADLCAAAGLHRRHSPSTGEAR